MYDAEFLKENGVDIEKCLELFETMETYNDTIQSFNSSITKKVAELDKYLKDEDMPNYAIYVHSLKSDSRYFGFTSLANIAYKHEMASKDNDLEYVKEHYGELMLEVDRIIDIVDTYLGKSKAKPVFEEINISELPSGTVILEEESKPTVVEEENSPIDNVSADCIEEQELEVLEEDIILVADDSEVVRVFVKKIFDTQYEIARASNGEEALDIIKEHEKDDKIKAVLLDLNMPKMDGFAVLEYMTNHDLMRKMPVTVISGDSSKEAISKAFDYEIVDMLNKPFSEQKIKDAVEKTINSKNNY